MIAKLTGILDTILDDGLIIDVGGVGYRVYCSAKTISSMPPLKQTISVYTLMHVREDHIHLYAFKDSYEQDAFNLITSVQGVGAKVGLAILSALSAQECMVALAAQDSGAFAKASGVGPKLAARIVAELKGKVKNLPAINTLPPENSAFNEAIEALVALGYSKSEVLLVLNKISPSLSGANAGNLVKVALKELARF